MPPGTDVFGATACEESLLASMDDLRVDVDRVKALEACKSVEAQVHGNASLEWTPGKEPGQLRFVKSSSESENRLQDHLTMNPFQERSGKRKIELSSATCTILLLVTFGTGRRRADRTHRIALVTDEPSVLTLSTHTTTVMAQGVTLRLSALQTKLYSISERTPQVSTTYIAPPNAAEREIKARFEQYIESSTALVITARKELTHAVIFSAGLLAMMIYHCYNREVFLRLNIQAACANLLWASGCWCYFTPLRIVESGLDVSLLEMCCTANRIVRSVQLFGLCVACFCH